MNLFKLKILLLSLSISYSSFINSQIIDDFNTVNYSFKKNNWEGDTTKFSVTNKALRLNNTPTTDTVLIFKKIPKWQQDSIVWIINIEHLFSASNNNYSLIYLASDEGFNESLYFKIGESGTTDKMKFYRNDASNMIHETNENSFGSNFNYLIKIIKIKENYQIYIDKKDGNNFVFDSQFNNNSNITELNIFGIKCRHTSSNSTKYIFDDIEINYKVYIDKTPPKVDSIIILSENQLEIRFSEPLYQNPFFKENINSLLNINSIDSISEKIYELTFENNFINFNNNKIIVSNIYDTLLNNNKNIEINWQIEQYGTTNYKSIIFNEILASPTSEIPYEFIEIYNKSDSYIRGESLSIHDKTNYNIFPKVTINPHQYYILCNTKDTSFFNKYGKTIGIDNFITLNNSNEELKIIANNLLIDSLNYTSIEPEKSLAYISINNNCFYNELWLSSEDEIGASPGYENIFSDDKNTYIQSVNYINDSIIQILLSSQIDTNNLKEISINYDQFDYFLTFNTIEKHLNFVIHQELERGVELEFILDNIHSCYQDEISLNFNLTLPHIPQNKEIIITEILSNTKDNQFDYIEITNNSNLFFNIKDLYINKLNTNGTVSSSNLSDSNIFIYPGNHFVFSENITWFNNYYNHVNEDFLFETELPSLNNDSNTIFITYEKDTIDIVSYRNNWHFELITDEKGVSLEKIDYQNNQNTASNWTSSASSNNFGSPTTINSHFKNNKQKNNSKNFFLNRSIFSPDNDGYQDLLEVSYDFSDTENIITATIYNENGGITKQLLTNETLPSRGTIIWDGINEHNQITPAGYYIIILENFNLNGKYTVEKIPFVIAKYL